MKNRFLITGLIALVVGACGDDVQIVEPTPPPTPPVTATMAPASATVAVGNSVVFAVNASGGAAGTAATWTCASSNTGIASASVTASGCQATGVAAGGVTITAVVTKGSETTNVGARLTVTAAPAPPAFEASIAPASATVAVGSSVVFAVNTSGGDMMMAASWECSSSDPAIATATTTDSGCEATGVAGGEVTINVAATDGNVTINLVAQLTVSTDPVAAFSAEMAPASATVAIESSVIFAINAQGGAADAEASWICTSSDEAIATVAGDDIGCAATGVAAGSVTIAAVVTKGSDSANLASDLTVTAPQVGEPAFVLLASVEDSDGEDPLSGQISVKVNVERGDQTLQHLGVLVDGEMVAVQPFGAAAAPPGDEPAEQVAVHIFTLSFDSDEYDRDTGATDFMNGGHVVSAELMVAGVDDAITSNSIDVEFDNADGVHVVASAPSGSALASDGNIWYGGPGTTLEIAVVPVLYSGGSADAVTMLGFCGAAGDTDDDGAPFEFAPDCEKKGETSTGVSPSFTITVGGASIGVLPEAILNGDNDIFPINLDYAGPGAPVFMPNPNDRADGWINDMVDFTAKHVTSGSRKNLDGWLFYGDDETVEDVDGVGGYTAQLRYGEDVEEALAATAYSSPTLPPASEDNDAYCFVASAVDKLDNESALPKASAGCADPEDSKDAVVAMDAVEDDPDTQDVDETMDAVEAAGEKMFSTLAAGVDVEDPTLEFTRDDKSPRRSVREFQVRASDEGNAGIHEGSPVMARVSLRNADETLCGAEISEDGDRKDSNGTGDIPGDPDDDCENTSLAATAGAGGSSPVITTDVFAGTPDADEMGYYTFAGYAVDKAGNRSAEITRTIAHDDQDPSVGVSILAAGDIDGPFDVTILMADNLSIRSFTKNGAYGTAYTIRLAEASFDAFNEPDLTTEKVVAERDIQPLLRLYAADGTDGAVTYSDGDVGGTPTHLSTLAVTVKDNGTGSTSATPVGVAVDDEVSGFSYTEEDDQTDAIESTEDAERVVSFAISEPAGDADDRTVEDGDAMVELEAEVKGAFGAFENPFDRVDFYVSDADTEGTLYKVASVMAFSASLDDDEGVVSDANDDERVWTYNVEVSADDLDSLVRGGADDDINRNLYAFGVAEKGTVALVSGAVVLIIEER